MPANLQAFNAAVTVSEGQKQSDISAASSAGDYNATVKRACEAHWSRVIEAGRVHGVRALNAEYALSQSLAGKTP